MRGGNKCAFAGKVWNATSGGNYFALNNYGGNKNIQKGGSLAALIPNPIKNIFRSNPISNIINSFNGSKLLRSPLPFKQSL
mgnify:FL=1